MPFKERTPFKERARQGRTPRKCGAHNAGLTIEPDDSPAVAQFKEDMAALNHSKAIKTGQIKEHVAEKDLTMKKELERRYGVTFLRVSKQC